MNTARFESSATELNAPAAKLPLERPPDEKSDVTLVRNRPAAAFAKTKGAEHDATPLSRLMLSQERLQGTVRSALPHRQTSQGLQVTVLTLETAFANQVKAALEDVNDVTIVASADEASALAAAQRCPILISDTTPTRSAIEDLKTQLRSHDPSIVFIVAGKRDQGSAFIGLQSSGAVDGFLLKPATAASTQLVVESATKRYRAANAKSEVTPAEPTRHSRPRPMRARDQTHTKVADAIELATPTVEAYVPPPSTSQTITPLVTAPQAAKHAPIPRPTWPLMIAAVAAVGAIVWWVTWQRLPDIDPRRVIAEQLALAERAHQDGQLTGARGSAAYHLQTVLTLDPANVAAQHGLERLATQLSRQSQTLISQQRLADATAAFERLRELKPDYPELPVLDAQLKRLQDAVLAAHTARAASEEIAPGAVAPGAVAPGSVAPPPVAPEPKPTIERTEKRAVAKAAPQLAGEQKQPTHEPVASTAPISAPTEAPSLPLHDTAPQPQTAPPPDQIVASSPAQGSPAAEEPAPRPTESSAASAPRAPTILKYVPPVYPSEAYARNLEGWVQVSLVVTPKGDVVNARIDDGDKRQLFARAALSAVKQWKYTPRPQATGETPVTVRLDFKLDGR